MENVKGVIEALGMEYWLALPILYVISGLRRVLDSVDWNVDRVGAFVFKEGFSEAVEDWVWRGAALAISLSFALALSLCGCLGGAAWPVVGLTHGAGAITAYHIIKTAKLTDKIGL